MVQTEVISVDNSEFATMLNVIDGTPFSRLLQGLINQRSGNSEVFNQALPKIIENIIIGRSESFRHFSQSDPESSIKNTHTNMMADYLVGNLPSIPLKDLLFVYSLTANQEIGQLYGYTTDGELEDSSKAIHYNATILAMTALCLAQRVQSEQLDQLLKNNLTIKQLISTIPKPSIKKIIEITME